MLHKNNSFFDFTIHPTTKQFLIFTFPQVIAINQQQSCVYLTKQSFVLYPVKQTSRFTLQNPFRTSAHDAVIPGQDQGSYPNDSTMSARALSNNK